MTVKARGDCPFKFGHISGKVVSKEGRFAQSDECANDLDAHDDRAL
jgi:hypothetical protein